MPETLDMDPDGCYPDHTGLEWYPSQHQNHVSIILCWYRDVARLRGLAIDRVEFALRVLRDLHWVHSAVHYSTDFVDHVVSVLGNALSCVLEGVSGVR